MRRFLFFLTIYNLLFTIYYLPQAYAQTKAIDVTSVYPIKDTQAVDGDILIYTDQGLVRANVGFSNQMFGVLQDKPLLIYHTENEKGKPVVRAGIAQVNVTTDNGAIKAGDYITSSNKAGKGQKAAQSGYVIGVALADYNKTGVGKISVAVRIEYAELTNTRNVVRLLDYFNLAAFQGGQDPNKASQFVKYFSVGIIVIGSLIFGFVIFARSMTKSIEALGRNPLAKNAIHLSILMNAVLAVVTILIAVVASYMILLL